MKYHQFCFYCKEVVLCEGGKKPHNGALCTIEVDECNEYHPEGDSITFYSGKTIFHQDCFVPRMEEVMLKMEEKEKETE